MVYCYYLVVGCDWSIYRPFIKNKYTNMREPYLNLFLNLDVLYEIMVSNRIRSMKVGVRHA